MTTTTRYGQRVAVSVADIESTNGEALRMTAKRVVDDLFDAVSPTQTIDPASLTLRVDPDGSDGYVVISGRIEATGGAR